MSFKLIVAMAILVTMGATMTCTRNKRILDRCRDSGYEIDNCEVGEGTLRKRFERRCTKLQGRYKKNCGEYECAEKQPGTDYKVIYSIGDNGGSARTHSKQYVKITGTKGETEEHECRGNFYVLDKDVVCTFRSDVDIGLYRCVHLRTGGSDGIDLVKVKVEVNGIEKHMIVPEGNAAYFGLDDGETKHFCVADYKVIYSIGDNGGSARTHSKQYVKITGTKGETEEHECRGNFYVLDKDVVCTFRSDVDIGLYRCVHLRTGGSDGIDLVKVKVEVNGIEKHMIVPEGNAAYFGLDDGETKHFCVAEECQAGQFLDGDCQDCPENHWSAAGNTEASCTACPDGKEVAAGQGKQENDCSKDEGETWPGEGWEAIDLDPSQATEVTNFRGVTETKFAILSEPVKYKDTRVQMVVKFLKQPFTKFTSLYPKVELLDDEGKILGDISIRLQYFVIDGKTEVGGDIGLIAKGTGKSCRSDAVKDFPTDEGPDMTFYLNQDRVVATFSGDKEVAVNFDKVDKCTDVVEAFEAVRDATTKVRFALYADAEMTDHLGEFVAVKYKFMETPP